MLAPFGSLRNRNFAQLYAAQTTSLFGDALTWVGLALLAYELADESAAAVLGAALTVRVVAFVMFSPVAGVLADRISRKVILVTADLARVAIVAVIPFVTEVWQVYLLIFLLNSFTAFFTPTYQATIPLVAGKSEYPQAIALSGATYELLGVLGPGVAGAAAAILGWQSIFWLDATTFLVSGVLILLLPARLNVSKLQINLVGAAGSKRRTWQDVQEGTLRLWRDSSLRYALVLELVASIAGAWLLVNTVVQVKGNLDLGDLHYGWVMAAFGVGATLAALAVGALEKRFARTTFILFGALASSLAILPANLVGIVPLMLLWFAAGAGQNWVRLPTQTLIADLIPEFAQGRVYGAHFAWSHLWWAGTYPLAGWVGSTFPAHSFLYGGLLSLALLAATYILFAPQKQLRTAAPDEA